MKFMSSSAVIAQLAVSLRQFIILRSIGLDNYGIAVPMILSSELLNRLLEMNPGSIVVQDEKGATRKFRNALQFMGVSRGILFCLIILALSVPLAIYNDQYTREYILAFMFMSLVPLIRGFSHIDVFRQMRQRRFGKLAYSSTVTPVATTSIIYVLCFFMNSFWVPLIARVIDAAIGLIMSFVVAERKWRIRFDLQSTIRIIKFTMPLIIGGLVVFICTRGSMLVLGGSEFLFGYDIPKSVLGTLSAAVMIAIIPGKLGMKVITQVFSPRFAQLNRDGGSISKMCEQVQALSFTLGAASLIMLQGGAIIVPLLLTERFVASGPFLVALSLWSALRVSGTAMKSMALGLGKSKIIMYSNFWSLLGFASSILVIYYQRDLVEIGYCMGIGELMSSISRSVMIKRLVPSVSLTTLFWKPGLVLLGALGIGIAQRYAIDGLSMPMAIVVMIVSIGVGTSALSLMWAPTRKMISKKIRG